MHKSVTINNIILKKMENFKFHSVIINSKLTWSTHISSIKRKVSRCIAILCKTMRLLKASALITLYYSFIHPYLTYCIEVWGNACDKYSLFKGPKRAVRIITSSPYLAHTLPIFSIPKILNIYNIYNYQVIIFMLKHKNRLLPSIFNDMFIQNNPIHSHNTRQANNIHVSALRSRLSQQTIRFTGIKLWNFLYSKLKTNISLSSYKHNIQEYIVANGFPIISDSKMFLVSTWISTLLFFSLSCLH